MKTKKIPYKVNYQTYPRVQITFPEKGRTHQSFANECDVNNIMAKYEKTGLIDHMNTHQGQYGHFVDVQDYQSAMNQVIEAREAFMSLPSSLRSRFANDPHEFLQFVNDPANDDEMRDMGLLPSEATEEPLTPADDDPPTIEPEPEPALL